MPRARNLPAGAAAALAFTLALTLFPAGELRAQEEIDNAMFAAIREVDLKQAAVVTAALLYQAAMRDGMIPRTAESGR